MHFHKYHYGNQLKLKFYNIDLCSKMFQVYNKTLLFRDWDKTFHAVNMTVNIALMLLWLFNKMATIKFHIFQKNEFRR